MLRRINAPNIFFSGFTSQPTISSPVIQSTTQVPGQCDFKGALQCTRTVGTDTLRRFATASLTNITEVENFCWRVYLHITKNLSFLFSNDTSKNMGVDIVDQLKFVLNNPVKGDGGTLVILYYHYIGKDT